MKKLNTLLLSALLLIPFSASAQLFDAIRGHVQDLKVRFDDHQKIEGDIIKRGQIDKNAKGQDLIHNSSGEWLLVKVGDQLFLQSSEDFRSSPGPDYHIYISSKSAIKDNDEFSAQQIEVSRVKKPNGAAFYLLKTQNPEDINSMLIWCKQFKEYIGSADLRPVK
ncbi:DM13 domain-containing protein [Polynucleobacter sp. UK-Mo-2m-Kol15]|uniref:DM13 domain-containing protein n=1 Tax=Polynucleobacter sp. UK-Mo-2m-Kol15 TaxID=2576916 RepID=UPI001C0DFDDA|nr:DM13 domain-containing protein [Polynucleobacter sp. UK-Mo-2m-Kol15]MBU3574435.1 DM13 domain-containing protein [Polynucleobacter sp. UK-Mo-2m-Kol15]